MFVTDTLEGTVDAVVWYHYDLTNDVLYLRLASYRETETVSEETAEGFLLLRSVETEEPVGLTVVHWWKRFGSGALPDSIEEVGQMIGPWARRLAA